MVPEAEDAEGADGERHQTEPRQGTRRMTMTQKSTGGGARDVPALNLDPPVIPLHGPYSTDLMMMMMMMMMMTPRNP